MVMTAADVTAIKTQEESRRLNEEQLQRAIVHYLSERFDESVEDCHRTVSRMPAHFGAWAGMGHCYAHLGKHVEAIRRVLPHVS